MPKAKKKKKSSYVELEDPNVFWMIRNKATGKFSVGGVIGPSFRTVGKMWPTHQRLLAHIRQVDKAWKLSQTDDIWGWRHLRGEPHPYTGCEVVQFRRTAEVVMDCVGYGE